MADTGNGCTKKHASVIALCLTASTIVISILVGWLWADLRTGQDQFRQETTALRAAVSDGARERAVLQSELSGMRKTLDEIKGDVKELVRRPSQP